MHDPQEIQATRELYKKLASILTHNPEPRPGRPTVTRPTLGHSTATRELVESMRVYHSDARVGHLDGDLWRPVAAEPWIEVRP